MNERFDYRVMRWNGVQDGDLVVHMVSYDEDGAVDGCDALPEIIQGSNIQDLLERSRMMAEAFSKPILDYDTLQEVNPPVEVDIPLPVQMMKPVTLPSETSIAAAFSQAGMVDIPPAKRVLEVVTLKTKRNLKKA